MTGNILTITHDDPSLSAYSPTRPVSNLQTGLDAVAERRYRRVAAAVGLSVCSVGAIVVLLWMRYQSGLIPVEAASGFCLAGLTLALQCLQPRTNRILRSVVGILTLLMALLLMLLGIVFLADRLVLPPTGLDQLRETLLKALAGRQEAAMHPMSAGGFVLTGLALLLQDYRLRRGTSPTEYLALALIAGSLVPLAGYLYGVTVLTSLAWNGPMPSIAALAFLALGCGTLLSRPSRRLMSIITENVPGGQMLRKSLPQTLMLLVVLNWLVDRGAQDGYYATTMAAPLLTLLNSAVILMLFWRAAFTVNNEYRGRLQSAIDLADATALLIAVSDHTEDAIFVKDRDGRLIFANPAMLRRLGKTRDQALYCTNHALLSDPAEADRVTADDLRIMQTGRSEVIEQTLHYADGLHTTITTKTPWFDSNGIMRGITAISTDISQRKAMEQQLKQREAELESTIDQRTATLRKLADHLETVREEEKRAIARELHDDMGAALTSLSMYLDSIYSALPTVSPWPEKIQKIQQLVRSLVATTRRIQIELRPIMLDLFGLKAGITEQMEEFAQRTGINCKTSLPDEDIKLDGKLDITIYRMLQEALNNVAKHSQARHVEVILDIDEDRIALTIRDDGIGISDERLHNQSTYGLRGLAERASFLGGTAKIFAVTSGGTTVAIVLPTSLH